MGIYIFMSRVGDGHLTLSGGKHAEHNQAIDLTEEEENKPDIKKMIDLGKTGVTELDTLVPAEKAEKAEKEKEKAAKEEAEKEAKADEEIKKREAEIKRKQTEKSAKKDKEAAAKRKARAKK